MWVYPYQYIDICAEITRCIRPGYLNIQRVTGGREVASLAR
jgi:hypothetical protein